MCTLDKQFDSCVIIVDLQKEFFSQKGIMKDRHFNFEAYIERYKTFVEYCEKNGIEIFWIRSNYLNSKPDDGFLTHDDLDKQCCYYGTHGYEFIDEIKDFLHLCTFKTPKI